MTSSSCWQAVSARDSRGKFIDSDSSNDLSSSLSPELVTIHCFEACKSHGSFLLLHFERQIIFFSQIFSKTVLVSEIWQAEIYSPPSTVVLGKMGKTQSLWMCNSYSARAGRSPKEELVSRFCQTLCWQEQWNPTRELLVENQSADCSLSMILRDRKVVMEDLAEIWYQRINWMLSGRHHSNLSGEST